jgi:dipeptidyl aminopeptidase/acylaminoacyl peptidase
VLNGARWITSFDAVGDTIAFTATGITEPTELFTAIGGKERQLTNVQAAFVHACPPLDAERLNVPSPQGDVDLDVWLLRPPGFDPASRYPMLLTVHGGPMTQYGNRWFDEVQLYASAGYVVVYTNPHGSTGDTDAFLRAIRAPNASDDPGTGWGGIDYEDLMAVVDAALAHEPAIDATRLGMLGGSYGGYMATWIAGHTNRFAALCSERAVNNLATLEWTSDIAGIFRLETGIDPFESREEIDRQSPITYVRDIDTPMLIVHSEHDLRCPIEQADQLFSQLRLLGKPVEYWRFPGEGHELSRSGSPSHRVQRAEIILDFFGRHLAPTPH